VQMRRFNHP